jgi:hypothetical protein
MLCGVITACADTKVALVIGNSKYPAPLDLANPVNDARDLADSLKKMGFEVDLRLDLDKSHFDQALADFARSAERDRTPRRRIFMSASCRRDAFTLNPPRKSSSASFKDYEVFLQA